MNPSTFPCIHQSTHPCNLSAHPVDSVAIGGELIGFMFAQQRAIALLHQALAFLRLKRELYQRAYGAWVLE